MVSMSELYGWTTPQSHPYWSAARAYGWGYHRLSPSEWTCQCTRCGAEFALQRSGSLYECERCMNVRED